MTVAIAESKLQQITKQPTKQQKFIAKYQPDPIRFQIDCLDVNPAYVWSKMVEVAESVRDYQKTCVYAGHSVSKTFEAARLALWFLFTHKPSTVISTAPTFDQVEKILWKEIHLAHTNAKIPLGGRLTATQLDIDPARKWFAYGFATKPDTVTGEATRFQGYHNEYVLIIFDEAAGILPQIWKASEHLLANPNCKILVIGNPTSAYGSFADCENDPTWHCVNISVKDTPNYIEDRQVIPGVSGRDYEAMIRNKYGEDSNEYAIRILGRKPEYSVGTYLGKGLAKAEQDGRVGLIVHDATQPVYTFSDLGDVYSAWWFVQFIKGFVHLIDFYYDSEGRGLPVYATMLQDKRYVYGDHFTLPDVFETGSNKKSLHTGQYTVDVAKSLGIKFKSIDIPSRDDCIRAAQDLMNVCKFASAAQEGVDGLYDWRKRKNEALSTPDKPVYFDEAVKSWGRHVGDAFCGVAVAYRYTSIGGRVIGSLTQNLPRRDAGNQSPYNNNVLTRGLRCSR